MQKLIKDTLQSPFDLLQIAPSGFLIIIMVFLPKRKKNLNSFLGYSYRYSSILEICL